jgi:tetratricopeptide (TPR) repeat protein
MNTDLLNTLKRIIAEQGEDILANSQRLKGYISDYAVDESKVERRAFGRCIEHGAYIELKNATDAEARQAAKARVAQRVYEEEGLDNALCASAMDVLEAALFVEKNLCKKCGKELQDGWVTCPYCRADDKAKNEVHSAPVTQVEAVAEIAPQVKLIHRKKHTKRNVLIAAGVAGLVLITTLGLLNTPENREKRAEIYFEKAEAFYNENDYDEAVRAYTKVITLYDQNAKAYAMRGDAYRMKGEYDNAIQDYNKVIELDPQYISVYFYRGESYRQNEDYDSAILDYGKVIEIEPEDASLYAIRGVTYNQKGETQKAI